MNKNKVKKMLWISAGLFPIGVLSGFATTVNLDTNKNINITQTNSGEITNSINNFFNKEYSDDEKNEIIKILHNNDSVLEKFSLLKNSQENSTRVDAKDVEFYLNKIFNKELNQNDLYQLVYKMGKTKDDLEKEVLKISNDHLDDDNLAKFISQKNDNKVILNSQSEKSITFLELLNKVRDSAILATASSVIAISLSFAYGFSLNFVSMAAAIAQSVACVTITGISWGFYGKIVSLPEYKQIEFEKIYNVSGALSWIISVGHLPYKIIQFIKSFLSSWKIFINSIKALRLALIPTTFAAPSALPLLEVLSFMVGIMDILVSNPF